MIWTYRVFKDEDDYCVRTVYYEQDGALLAYDQAPAIPTGQTAAELAQDIQWFKEAFELPILTTAELDAELVAQEPKPKKQDGQRKTLDQIMAELEVSNSTCSEPLVFEAVEAI